LSVSAEDLLEWWKLVNGEWLSKRPTEPGLRGDHRIKPDRKRHSPDKKVDPLEKRY